VQVKLSLLKHVIRILPRATALKDENSVMVMIKLCYMHAEVLSVFMLRGHKVWLLNIACKTAIHEF
jgi:hypothetical protein